MIELEFEEARELIRQTLESATPPGPPFRVYTVDAQVRAIEAVIAVFRQAQKMHWSIKRPEGSIFNKEST
jgi:hypothetical protein